jgi:uncharacterized protein YjeT (DUF2065 family)
MRNSTSGSVTQPASRQSVSLADRLMLLYCGLSLLLPGLVLIGAPNFFYQALADFAPFNRHFMGDAGSFSLALGIGVLLALRNPAAHRLLIGVTALGNTIHVCNHLYDDLIVDGGNLRHLLTNTAPLLLMSLLLVVVWWRVRGAWE